MDSRKRRVVQQEGCIEKGLAQEKKKERKEWGDRNMEEVQERRECAGGGRAE